MTGAQLKAWRKSHNLTQGEMAVCLGRSQRSVQDIEAKPTVPASVASIIEFVDTFGTLPSWPHDIRKKMHIARAQT